MSLIESLLALMGMMILLVVGIKQYQHYHQNAEIQLVKSDTQQIMFALNNYFHNKGCHPDGRFSGSLQPGLTQDLKLASLSKGRGAYILNYQPSIVMLTDTQIDKKPLYQFKIDSKLAPTLTTTQINWYQKVLGASSANPTKHQVSWIAAINNSMSRSDHSYWVLNGARRAFRRRENKKGGLSLSNCAQ